MDIFSKLDNLIFEAKTKGEIDPEHSTAEQGKEAAINQWIETLMNMEMRKGGMKPPKGMKPESLNKIDDELPPLEMEKRKKGGGADTNFKENIVDMEKDDLEMALHDDDDDDDEDELDEDDFEWDDFNYDEEWKPKNDSEDDDDDEDGDDGDEDDEDGESGEDGDGDDDGESGNDNGGAGGGESGGQQGSQKSGGQKSGGQQGGQKSGGRHGRGGKETYDETVNRGIDEASKNETNEDAKRALDKVRNDKDQAGNALDEAEHSNEKKTDPGSIIETPDDETFRKEMEESGFDEKEINQMTKEKNTDTMSKVNHEDSQKKAAKQMSSKSSGGPSTIARTIKGAKGESKEELEIKEEQLDKIIEMFIGKKAEERSEHIAMNSEIAWGHKNGLYRGAILPKELMDDHGDIAKIYVFVDYSGSVQKEVVFVLLARVYDLMKEFQYTSFVVYGFGDVLSKPMEVTFENNEDTYSCLAGIWQDLAEQKIGQGTENLTQVSAEINKIKKKEDESIFLIFGDGYWRDNHVRAMNTIKCKDDTLTCVYGDCKDTYESIHSFGCPIVKSKVDVKSSAVGKRAQEEAEAERQRAMEE